MRSKESLKSNPYLFYQPEKRKTVNGARSFMACAMLRVAAFMMCPGDDISMILAAGNSHHSNMPESALLYKMPSIRRKENVILIKR